MLVPKCMAARLAQTCVHGPTVCRQWLHITHAALQCIHCRCAACKLHMYHGFPSIQSCHTVLSGGSQEVDCEECELQQVDKQCVQSESSAMRHDVVGSTWQCAWLLTASNRAEHHGNSHRVHSALHMLLCHTLSLDPTLQLICTRCPLQWQS